MRWQRVNEAVAEYRQALRVDPDFAAARRGLEQAAERGTAGPGSPGP